MLTPLRDRAAIAAASSRHGWTMSATQALGDLVEFHGMEVDLAVDATGVAALWLRHPGADDDEIVMPATCPGISNWLVGFAAGCRRRVRPKPEESVFDTLYELMDAASDVLSRHSSVRLTREGLSLTKAADRAAAVFDELDRARKTGAAVAAGGA